MIEGWAFNPPPNWPRPPGGWSPPRGWTPDPAWGPVPPGWQLWVPERRGKQRGGVLPAAGLGALLLIALVGTVIPRAGGPVAGDPRAGGSIAAVAPLSPDATPDPPSSTPASARPSAAATPRPTTTRPAAAAGARRFASCRQLNRLYRNGIGRPDAVDKTKGKPVTGFGRSTTLYRANSAFDKDRDGIACEP